jgi:hypothetical protein
MRSRSRVIRSEVELNSLCFNAGAQEAFHRLGFTPQGVTFAYRNGDDGT